MSSLGFLRSTTAVLVAACAFLVVFPGMAVDNAQAADGHTITDKTETISIQTPKGWRTEDSAHTIAASGFLGIFRVRLYVQVYVGTDGADAAMTKWKAWRAKRGEAAYTEHDDDERQVIAQSKLTTEFVRAIPGKGRAAVAWIEVKGRLDGQENDAFTVLSSATWFEKAAPPAAEGNSAESVEPLKLKDPEYRVEFTLPGNLVQVHRKKSTARRFAMFEGKLGSDPTARVDLYAFPEFDRADALVTWWKDQERIDWPDPVKFEDGSAVDEFRVLVDGRLWNRSVRVLATDAGLYAVKVDADAQAQKDVDRFLGGVAKGGVKVLRPRKADPVPPQGFKQVEHPTHHVFVEIGAEPVEKLVALGSTSETHLKGLMPLEPWDGRRGLMLVYRNRAAYDAAVRPLGGVSGTSCHWTPALRRVITFAGADKTKKDQASLLLALTRDGLQRRFGFPPPFWIDQGYGLLVAGSVHVKGRTNVGTPEWVEGARNAAAGSVDFEATRFWTHAKSVDNPERLAVVWAFAFLFHEGSVLSKKWSGDMQKYLAELRRTADPIAAGKIFGFDRQVELVADFKKRIRKL